MTTELVGPAQALADALTESLDGDDRVSYLDVLDALATSGLTLTVDEAQNASKTYAVAAEMEGLLI